MTAVAPSWPPCAASTLFTFPPTSSKNPATRPPSSRPQVSLFGGPCYALYRGPNAVKLARQLTAPAPRRARFLDGHEDPRPRRDRPLLVSTPPTNRTGSPRARVASPASPSFLELESVPSTKLKALLDGFPFAAGVLDQVAAAYQPGRTWARLFAPSSPRCCAARPDLLRSP